MAVGGGHAAIEDIRREPPDIVLADTRMPEGDGYEVADFVRKRPGAVPHPGRPADRRLRPGRHAARAGGRIPRRAGQAVRGAAGDRHGARPAGRSRRWPRPLPCRSSPAEPATPPVAITAPAAADAVRGILGESRGSDRAVAGAGRRRPPGARAAARSSRRPRATLRRPRGGAGAGRRGIGAGRRLRRAPGRRAARRGGRLRRAARPFRRIALPASGSDRVGRRRPRRRPPLRHLSPGAGRRRRLRGRRAGRPRGDRAQRGAAPAERARPSPSTMAPSGTVTLSVAAAGERGASSTRRSCAPRSRSFAGGALARHRSGVPRPGS